MVPSKVHRYGKTGVIGAGSKAQLAMSSPEEASAATRPKDFLYFTSKGSSRDNLGLFQPLDHLRGQIRADSHPHRR
jgi:hypothetical protein